MSQSSISKSPSPEPAPEAHLPNGENPRHLSGDDLDGTPPQPDAPAQSEKEQQQDQLPLDSHDAMHRPEHLAGKQNELLNG